MKILFSRIVACSTGNVDAKVPTLILVGCMFDAAVVDYNAQEGAPTTSAGSTIIGYRPLSLSLQVRSLLDRNLYY